MNPYPMMSIVAAGMDYAGVASLIAAFTATIALVFGHRNNRRAAKTSESVSYVDTNLRVMQGTLDWLTAENVRLKAKNEEQRLQIIDLDEEQQRMEEIEKKQAGKIRTLERQQKQLLAELEKCKALCASIKGQLQEDRKTDESSDEPTRQ